MMRSFPVVLPAAAAAELMVVAVAVEEAGARSSGNGSPGAALAVA